MGDGTHWYINWKHTGFKSVSTEYSERALVYQLLVQVITRYARRALGGSHAEALCGLWRQCNLASTASAGSSSA